MAHVPAYVAALAEAAAQATGAERARRLADLAWSETTLDPRRAARRAWEALAALRGLVLAPGERWPIEAAARAVLAAVHRRGDRHDRARQLALEVLEQPVRDGVVEARALTTLVEVALYRGERIEARALCARALNLVRGTRTDLEAGLLNNRGRLAYQAQQYDAAEHDYRAAGAVYHQLGHPAGEAVCLVNLGNLLSQRGDLDQSVERYRAALALTEYAGDRYLAAIVHLNLGSVLSRLGEEGRAVGSCLRCLELAAERDAGVLRVGALLTMGRAQRRAGELEPARAALEEAGCLANELGLRARAAQAELELARVDEVLGDRDGARGRLQGCLADLLRAGEVESEIEARLALLRLRLDGESAVRLLAELDQLVPRLRELPLPTARAEAWWEATRLCVALGQPELAQDCHAEAVEATQRVRCGAASQRAQVLESGGWEA